MAISPRKLIRMAKKWQKLASQGRKRISFQTKTYEASTSDYCTSEIAGKGHFIVYTADEARFSFPIAYLSTLIFRELFRMSEEEFGLPSDGPITLPCDSQLMGYICSLMQKGAAMEVEKALLLSMADFRCSSSYYVHHQQQQTSQQRTLFVR